MLNVRKREYDDDEYDEKPCSSSSNKSLVAKGAPPKKQKLFFDPQYTTILERSEYRLVTFKSQSNKYRRCLVIFMTSEKNFCFEYFWNAQQKRFYCAGCRMRQKNNTAMIEDGCTVKTEDKLHDCEPLFYEPQRYVELELLKQTNFEIIGKRDHDGSKYLVVFSPEDYSQCHEYKCKKGQQVYVCTQCDSASARVWDNTEDEQFVELYDLVAGDGAVHACETIEYNPEKYYPRNSSSASLGDDVSMSAEDKPDVKPAVEQKNDIILRPPEVEYIDSPEFHLPKIFIFDKEDPSLCYTFTPFRVGDGTKFYCISCDWYKRKPKVKAEVQSSENTEIKGVVTAYLCKNEENEEDYYVKMFDDRKHLCKPKKYDPEKYMIKSDTIYDPSEFFLFSYKKKFKGIYAAIYATKNKSTCRIFRCTNPSQTFVCSACQKQKNYVSARCFMNEKEGTEYLKVKQTPHICSPISVGKLLRSVNILKESGLNLVENSKEKIDESKIIRKPAFELQNLETPDQRLIIFVDEDRTLCYKYSYSKYRNQYWCLGCTRVNRNVKVKAVLKVDDEDESYLTLGEREHICEPVKYEPEKADIVTTNFTILHQENESLQKLIIFTSAAKELCYIYHKHGTIFRCTNCYKTSKKSISAKLCFSEYGEEYVKVLNTNHSCEPEPYLPGAIESKVIPESGFMLVAGPKGTSNTKMIIFDQSKDGYMYEFKSKSKNQYLCVECLKLKQTTIAKLRDNGNDGKYVLMDKEHVCKSIKYDPEKFSQKKVIYDGFAILPSTKENIKKLILFSDDECINGYEFVFQRHCNTFLCNGCEETPVRAKLKIDKDGNEFIEVGTRKHSCRTRNFKECKFPLSSYKYIDDIENEQKMIVVTHPITKASYEMLFDEILDAYCCLKCKDKNKFVAAVPAKNKNDEEFLLMNKPHVCC